MTPSTPRQVFVHRPAHTAGLPVRLHHIIIDAHDLPGLARFWAQALGWRVLPGRPREIGDPPGADARQLSPARTGPTSRPVAVQLAAVRLVRSGGPRSG